MHLHTTTVPTPVGPFTLLVDGDGVCAAGFSGRPETLQRRLDPRRRAASVRPATDPHALASRMLAYLEGEAGALDQVVSGPARRPGPAGRLGGPRGPCRPGRRSATRNSAPWPGWPTRPPTPSAPRPCRGRVREQPRGRDRALPPGAPRRRPPRRRPAWGIHRKAWLLSHEQAPGAHAGSGGGSGSGG